MAIAWGYSPSNRLSAAPRRGGCYPDPGRGWRAYDGSEDLGRHAGTPSPYWVSEWWTTIVRKGLPWKTIVGSCERRALSECPLGQEGEVDHNSWSKYCYRRRRSSIPGPILRGHRVQLSSLGRIACQGVSHSLRWEWRGPARDNPWKTHTWRSCVAGC